MRRPLVLRRSPTGCRMPCCSSRSERPQLRWPEACRLPVDGRTGRDHGSPGIRPRDVASSRHLRPRPPHARSHHCSRYGPDERAPDGGAGTGSHGPILAVERGRQRSAASSAELFRRTNLIGIRAEHTAVTGERPEERAARRACVEEPTGVRRHRLGFCETTLRASDCRGEDRGRHASIVGRSVRGHSRTPAQAGGLPAGGT